MFASPTVQDAWARLLKPGARVVPRIGRMYGALVRYHPGHGCVNGVKSAAVQGLFGPQSKASPHLHMHERLDDFTVLSKETLIFTFDFERPETLGSQRKIVEFDAVSQQQSNDAFKPSCRAGVHVKEGVVNAIVLWFELDLCPGTTLSTGPESPRTHWEQRLSVFGVEMPVFPRYKPRCEIGHDCHVIDRLELLPADNETVYGLPENDPAGLRLPRDFHDLTRPHDTVEKGQVRRVGDLFNKYDGEQDVPKRRFFEALTAMEWNSNQTAHYYGEDAETLSFQHLRLPDILKGFCLPRKTKVFYPVHSAPEAWPFVRPVDEGGL
eukprot:scaffold3697_cov390-Prasinococcus_capsulatus_cf.AAC.14